jgi:WD40 repeat protein
VGASADGWLVMTSGSAPLTPDIWDMVARRRVSRLIGAAYDTDSAFFSPDRRTIVTRGRQQRTSGDTGYTAYEWKVWDVQTGRLLWSFGKDEYVVSVCFSPDSRFLLSRGQILEARTGKVVRTLEAPSADASVLFSLDGKMDAASSAEQAAFWDARTGKRHVSPLGHP